VIFPVQEVLERNQGLQIAKQLPGYFAFGSSGGGCSLLFNTKEDRPWKVYWTDDVGMQEEYISESTQDFGAFIRAMGRPSPDSSHESEIAPKDVEQWLRRQGRLP
jgi:hypothetical protein